MEADFFLYKTRCVCHLPHGAALSNLPYYKKTVNEQQTKAEENNNNIQVYETIWIHICKSV